MSDIPVMHKPANIKITFINLDRRPDRFKSMVNNFKKNNINNYVRFKAIDGKNLIIDKNIEEMFKDNTFGWRRGVIGAALSHYTLWKELVNSKFDYYLIMEDDIILNDNFDVYLKDIKNKISLATFPFIFLGFHTDKECLRNPLLVNNKENEVTIHEIKVGKYIWGGLFGYIIHKKTAESFVNDINTFGLTEPIDTFIIKKNNLYVAYPLIITSPCMTFFNYVDSDIQYDLLSAFDDYEYFQGLDSPNNDIKWVPAKTFEELKKAADEDDNCVAFNTYAFLKHTICDPKDFIPIPCSNSKAHGIYVKKSYLIKSNIL